MLAHARRSSNWRAPWECIERSGDLFGELQLLPGVTNANQRNALVGKRGAGVERASMFCQASDTKRPSIGADVDASGKYVTPKTGRDKALAGYGATSSPGGKRRR